MPPPAQQGEIAPAGAASLLHDGRRKPVGPEGATIGRGADNAIVLDDERASRHHARIELGEAGFTLTDRGSHNGTLLNGERFFDAARPLADGDMVVIGDQILRFLSGQETRMASRELPVVGVQTVAFDGERLTLGRGRRNDVVLDNPNVSRFHAEVVARGGAIELLDLGSRNGTRLDGEPVERAVLDTGSEIGIGPYRLLFDGSSFLARDEQGAVRLEAEGIVVQVDGRRILQPTSVALGPGELVAIIGESGSGKSTLLKCLAGVNAPSSGRVSVNGEPLAHRLTDIGYVPQDEIVHDRLTVREGLTYAARLRLPGDSASDEISAAVERVASELDLERTLDQRIDSLSGGQRKRAGVGTELLGRPGLLFLDEPTTGMDPALESRMMALFRELADKRRGVALVTHATRNLSLCDRVVVLAGGGIRVFEGTPDEVLRFFDADSYDAVYTALEEQPGEEWQRRFEESESGRRQAPDEKAEAAPAVGARRRGPPLRAQMATLTSRYLKLLQRDRRNLVLLLAQPPILALTGVALFSAGVFDRSANRPNDAIQMLFLAILTMVWLGGIDSVRELVKDRGVMQREAAIGTRLSAYLTSKLVVLCALVTVQVLLYSGVLLAFRPLDASSQAYVEVVLLLVVTGFVAVAMGLAISSLAGTQDQAMSFLPLAIIPQIVFSGAIVAVESMTGAGKALAYLSFARWGLSGSGEALDMNARLVATPELAHVNRYGTDFFNVATGRALLLLALFFVLLLAACAWALRPLRR